jgi:hypothetical protein
MRLPLGRARPRLPQRYDALGAIAENISIAARNFFEKNAATPPPRRGKSDLSRFFKAMH